MNDQARILFGILILTFALALKSATAQAVGSARPVWFRSQITQDLTGDGRPDTLVLEARGTQADSLSVVFQIRSAGRQIYYEEWNNEYDFVDLSFPTEPGARADSLSRLARHPLQSFLGPNRLIRLDTTAAKEPWPVAEPRSCHGDPRDCIAWYFRFEAQIRGRVAAGRDSLPEGGQPYRAFLDSIQAAPFDTARVRTIWADMRQHTPHSFVMSHGYETTKVIAWSRVERRFLVLFECC